MDEEGDCPKVGEVEDDAVGNGVLGTLFLGSGNLVDGVFFGGGMSPPIPYLDCKVANAASKSFCGGFLSGIRGAVEVIVVDDCRDVMEGLGFSGFFSAIFTRK